MLREIERIACGGVDRIGCGQTDGAMVRVQRVGPKRIMSDDDVRLVCTDHAHDLLAQFEVWHERAVGTAEKDDLVYAKPVCRLDQLRLSCPRNFCRVGGGIRAPAVT